MKLLKPASRRALERLRDAEDSDDRDHDEIVCEGIICYIGLNQIHRKTVNSLLEIMAISDSSIREVGSNMRRYRINESGRNVLKDESQINMIYKMLRDGGAWTWRDGKLVVMDDPNKGVDSGKATP